MEALIAKRSVRIIMEPKRPMILALLMKRIQTSGNMLKGTIPLSRLVVTISKALIKQLVPNNKRVIIRTLS